MNLNDIPIFIKVVELMGFSAAARSLGIPKSKVSRRIAQLEEDLGVRLIERNTRTVKLTEMGDVFYRHCLSVMHEAVSAKEAIVERKEDPQGVIRISTYVSIGQYLLAPLLADFQSMYPSIELDIHLTNRRVDLIAEGFDLVVRVGDLEDSNLISKCLLDSSGGVFCSQKYINKYGDINNLAQFNTFAKNYVVSGLYLINLHPILSFFNFILIVYMKSGSTLYGSSRSCFNLFNIPSR